MIFNGSLKEISDCQAKNLMDIVGDIMLHKMENSNM